jgi:hypothetical protein
MAKLSILAGATSQTINIFIQNSSVTTGAGLTGLAYNSGSLTAYYTFPKTSPVAISLVTQTATGAYSSGGFVEIDSTNNKGLYRLDIPNAAIASGNGRFVTILLQGATNMVPCVLEIELTAIDNQSVAFGLSIAKTTNITGFNDIAASAIVSSGAITTSGGAVSTVTNLTNAPTAGDFTATMKTSLNSSTPASVTTVTGNVNGSVNSVTTGVTVTTNNDKTGYSLTQAFPSNFSSLAITAGGAAKIDGTSALTESYAAQGAALTLAQALYGINQFLGQHSTSSTTWIVKKRDGTTTAKTYTLDSASAPTSITEAT